MKLRLDDQHLLATNLPAEFPMNKTVAARGKELLNIMKDTHTKYEDRRRVMTNRWLECWASYLGTPEAQDYLRAESMSKTVGEVRADWRHKISTGKSYEIVETIIGYLMGATFPNKDWFDMLPEAPLPPDSDYVKFVRIMRSFLNMKLEQSHFRDKYECFLRQLIICGTSVMSIPWRLETQKVRKNVKVRVHNKDRVTFKEIEKCIYNAPDITVEDMNDVWLDPDASDPSTANLMRRMIKSKGEVIRLIDTGVYDLGDKMDIMRTKHYKIFKTDNREKLEYFQGISSDSDDWHPQDTVEVFEFWGTVQTSDKEYSDVVITFVDNALLRVETNPYWGGKPFIVGTYTPVPNSPYGIGALEPVLGLLHSHNIIANNRLDAIELAVNPMFLMMDDGTTNPEEVYSEPGRIIPVHDMGAIQPLNQDRGFQGVSLTEEGHIEQTIDKTAGTGAFVGSGATRSGERVTATEVQAVRDAGGNRLSSIHGHIEDTSLLPFLQRTYVYAQQFVVESEVVPVKGNQADEWWYANVGIDQLYIDFKIIPRGAQHVADREFELRMRTEWIATITAVPEMAQLVNWKEVAVDVTSRFTGEEATRFINDEPAEPPPDPAAMAEQVPPSTDDLMVEGAQQVGGAELAQAVQAQQLAGQQMSAVNAQESGVAPQVQI
jgi:Bacteriophage head to tail connecting protein